MLSVDSAAAIVTLPLTGGSPRGRFEGVAFADPPPIGAHPSAHGHLSNPLQRAATAPGTTLPIAMLTATSSTLALPNMPE